MKKEKKSFNIYVLGNLLVKEDDIPLRILPRLKDLFNNINFLELDPTENLPEEKNLIIIDTIININKITILNDINKTSLNKNYSLHDFDLGFNLKLMKKMNKLNKVTIIGLPINIKPEKALEELKRIIPNLLLRNE